MGYVLMWATGCNLKSSCLEYIDFDPNNPIWAGVMIWMEIICHQFQYNQYDFVTAPLPTAGLELWEHWHCWQQQRQQQVWDGAAERDGGGTPRAPHLCGEEPPARVQHLVCSGQTAKVQRLPIQTICDTDNLTLIKLSNLIFEFFFLVGFQRSHLETGPFIDLHGESQTLTP